MSTNSAIEWTDATWNPVTGCTRASAGCDNCYAVKQTYRLEKMGQEGKYGGLTVLNARGERHFNGIIRCHEDALSIPLKRTRPTTYFVNSMSDLFHRDVPFEFVDKVFAVMALTPQHTYQVLTKRPERMSEYLNDSRSILGMKVDESVWKLAACMDGKRFTQAYRPRLDDIGHWPLPNVWLGTSVEDQVAADQRIPHLLKCPAAVRFLSVEPLLGAVEFSNVMKRSDAVLQLGKKSLNGILWVIVGGESGPKARPCNVEWVRSIVKQCKAADVPCFVKQLGARIELRNDTSREWPRQGDELNWEADDLGYQGELAIARLNDRKGGDINEWPIDLRVREFPACAEAVIGVR